MNHCSSLQSVYLLVEKRRAHAYSGKPAVEVEVSFFRISRKSYPPCFRIITHLRSHFYLSSVLVHHFILSMNARINDNVRL